MKKHTYLLRSKILLTIPLSILYTFCFSQNLVPNPSFENENICIKYYENCSPAAWRSTTLKQFLYPEYLAHQRESTAIRPPEGTRFIGLRVFNLKRKFDRSIVQVPLICGLEKGKKYKVKFDYLSSTFWVNSFHIQFVDTLKVHANNQEIIKNESQITIEFQTPPERKKWLTYETIYEAKGNEVGFILGNLKSDEQTKVTRFEKRKDKDKTRVYYYFDNFSLESIEEISNCDIEKNLQFIYQDSIRHKPNSVIKDVSMIRNLPPTPSLISSSPKIIEQPTPTPPTPIKTEIKRDEIFTLKNILFESNSDLLLPISYSSLMDLVSFLKKNTDLEVIITGHTDDVGNDFDNLKLSEKRAQSVASFLIKNNIIPDRIKTIGKGETEHISNNTTPENRKKNRRVEFQLKRTNP